MKQEATQQWRKPPQESWDFQSEEHVKYQPLATTDLTPAVIGGKIAA